MCCRWQYWEFEPRDVRSLRPGSKTEPPAEGWWSYSQLGCQESDTLNRSSSLDGDSGGAACGGCGVWWCPCGYVPIPSPFFNVDCGRNPHGQLTYYIDFLDVKGGGIFGVVGGWKGEANYVKRRECCAELEIGVAPLRGDV
eukprot:gene6166-13266_t